VMAAGDTMQGRRVDLADGASIDSVIFGMAPGDYVLAHDGVPWVVLPNGVAPCRLGGWQVEVHEDGTITTSPSILDHDTGWHGYLEHGAWREV